MKLPNYSETVAQTGRVDSSGRFTGLSPTDVVLEGYARYARRDLAGVFALFSPDIEFSQTTELPWGGRYHGLSGAREYFSLLHRHTEGGIVPLMYVPAGNDVAVVAKIWGKVRVTGKRFDIGVVHVWTVHKGWVIRCAAFVDTPAMQEALRIEGVPSRQ